MSVCMCVCVCVCVCVRRLDYLFTDIDLFNTKAILAGEQ